MNNFFKIHKVKILKEIDNFKFSGSYFRTIQIVWAPFPPSVPAFFIIAKKAKLSIEPFHHRNNKKELHSGRGADSCFESTFTF